MPRNLANYTCNALLRGTSFIEIRLDAAGAFEAQSFQSSSNVPASGASQFREMISVRACSRSRRRRNSSTRATNSPISSGVGMTPASYCTKFSRLRLMLPPASRARSRGVGDGAAESSGKYVAQYRPEVILPANVDLIERALQVEQEFGIAFDANLPVGKRPLAVGKQSEQLRCRAANRHVRRFAQRFRIERTQANAARVEQQVEPGMRGSRLDPLAMETREIAGDMGIPGDQPVDQFLDRKQQRRTGQGKRHGANQAAASAGFRPTCTAQTPSITL